MARPVTHSVTVSAQCRPKPARLKQKLAPETVGVAFILAGAFLTGHELVKASIFNGVRDFFLTGFDAHEGKIYSQSYQLKVLPLGKDPFVASVV